MKTTSNWWRGGVVYQIYPRSFADSNGDGIGDLRGAASRLDYVADLGVDAVWLSPFFKSPMKDFGYDISDYRAVDEIFGDLADFELFVARAHSLGLKVIIDQVLSHTSDQHAWFAESRRSRDNPKSDWYVWADPKDDGSPPNNWLSLFGGGAWSWDSTREQFYLHNFLESQPDLNFHNGEVRDAQIDNMRFWLDLGVDGFRLDVVNFYFHSDTLEDNPAVPAGCERMNGLSPDNPYGQQLHLYDVSQPENLSYLRTVRKLLDEYPDTTSVGEISAGDALAVMAEYTAGNDKLHMAYTFDLLTEKCSADWIRQVVRNTESKIQDGWPCWALSNHDVARVVSRWGRDSDPAAFAPVAIATMLSLRGSSCLYQGDELGLPEAQVPRERMQDPYGLQFWPAYSGRDGCRTPMVWEPKDKGGFSAVEGWLPVEPRHLPMSVASQLEDPASALNRIKALIKWRKQQPALIDGDIQLVENTGEMLCWIRSAAEQRMLVALNLTAETQRASVPYAVATVHDNLGFEGSVEGGAIVLGPFQALFADLG
ncbi:MAG: alpha-amylase family glycosyl hydrolase [Pseudomonadota bacterium]